MSRTGTSWEHQRMNSKRRIAWGAQTFLSPKTRDQIMEALFPPPPGYGAISPAPQQSEPAPLPARKPIDYSVRMFRQDGIDRRGGRYSLLIKVGGAEHWLTLPASAWIELAENQQIETTEIFSRLGAGVQFDRAWLRGWFERHAPALVTAFNSEVPNHA